MAERKGLRTAEPNVSNDKVFRTNNALENTDSTNPLIERIHLGRDLIIEASKLVTAQRRGHFPRNYNPQETLPCKPFLVSSN